jgi:CRP-like cAMP-binding protein
MLRREEIHVIVIDLDIKRCEAIRDELQRWGVERIQCSQYGRQVQKIVSHHPFDLVILGDRFEMGNSQEIYDLLQEHPSTAGAPTLWMAADPSPEEQRIMISKGCCGILRYPIEPQEVRRALADFFRRVRGKELRNRLQDAEFFKDFTNKERNAIAKEAILRRFDAGETILSKGDEARRFYVLLKGSVEVYTRSKSTGAHALVVPAGQPFGELAVLDRNPRSAHCIARTECLALEIGAQILDDNGYALTAKIFASLARSLAHRLRTMNEVNDRMEARLQELEYLSSLSKPLPAPNAPVTSTENYLIPPPCESAEADPDIADELHFDSEDVAEEEAKPLIPAEADLIDHSVQGDDAYDVLQRKITLRSDFILAKLPRALRELFANKLYGYFTGSKLAKMNPQKLWSPKWFAGAVPHLKHSLHLVVCSRDGFRAYEDAYLNLPFSHRIIGLSDTGCTGTFLGDAPSIERYFAKKPLKRALEKDL